MNTSRARTEGEEDGLAAVMEAAPSRSSWRTWLALALVLLVTAALRVRLLDAPLERDEGEYAYGGQLLLEGVPPYSAEYSLKLPGAPAAYALAMGVFGQTRVGIRLGLLLVNAATTVLVFLLARRWFDGGAGLAAAAVFAVYTLSPSTHGIFANAEHFVLPFAVAGFLILDRALENGRLRTLAASGLLFGLGVIMKQTGAAFAVAGGLAVLATELRRRPRRWPLVLRRLAVLTGATIASYLAVCVWLAASGVFDAFWFWTVTYAGAYADQMGLAKLPSLLVLAVPVVLGDLRIVVALALVGLLALFWSAGLRRRVPLILPLAVLSCAAVSAGGYFRAHYFLFLGPVLGILVGGLVFATRRANTSGTAGAPGRARVSVRAAVALLLAVACLEPLVRQREIFFTLPVDRVVRTLFGWQNPFTEAIETARYVAERTRENDRVAVLGSEPELYFYSRRRSATGYVYMYPLMEIHPYVRRMQEQMIREVEEAEPIILVYVHSVTSWLRRPDSDPLVLDWLREYLRGYRLEAMAVAGPKRSEFRTGRALELPLPPPEITRIEVYRRL